MAGAAIQYLVAQQHGTGIRVSPIGDVPDDGQIVVTEIRPHEALVLGARADLSDALQLGKIQPLLIFPVWVGPL